MKQISTSIIKKFALSFSFVAAFILIANQGYSRNSISPKNEVRVDSVSNAHVVTVKDAITIKNNDGMHGMVRIYSTSGKRLSQTLLYAGINKIDVSNLAHDEYIACVTMDGGARFNQKFIKE